MKQGFVAVTIIVSSILGILLLNSAFTVDQTEQVVVTQFGEPIGPPIEEPGLHWKSPFVQELHRFDKRILEWDGYPSEVPTRDKKFIWVDVTGRWQIKDPLKFLQTMHNERNAQSRLDDIMDGVTRNFITKYNLVDVVRNSNRILDVATKDHEDIAAESDIEKIDQGRNAITRQILETARTVLSDYGIELIDLQIKRINYIPSVQQKVFERMISERKRSAEQLRSEGQGICAEIAGQMDKELRRITSEAYHASQKLKGEADAQATQIYGDAYSKDPEFYDFTATLESYPDALRGGKLVLSTKSDYLKYLQQANVKDSHV